MCWLIAVQLLRAGAPPLYLGWGAADRFAPAQRVLAEALPPQRVFTAPGAADIEASSSLPRLCVFRRDIDIDTKPESPS